MIAWTRRRYPAYSPGKCWLIIRSSSLAFHQRAPQSAANRAKTQRDPRPNGECESGEHEQVGRDSQREARMPELRV